jgi:hypothetical protein
MFWFVGLVWKTKKELKRGGAGMARTLRDIIEYKSSNKNQMKRPLVSSVFYAKTRTLFPRI